MNYTDQSSGTYRGHRYSIRRTFADAKEYEGIHESAVVAIMVMLDGKSIAPSTRGYVPDHIDPEPAVRAYIDYCEQRIS